MKLLVLGGTTFVGRHLVEAALARGWDATLFDGDRPTPDPFPADRYPQLERLWGDSPLEVLVEVLGDSPAETRGGGSAPAGRTWDAAIDTCGDRPEVVRACGERLADVVGRYVFVSSLAAYANLAVPGITESDPLRSLDELAGNFEGDLEGKRDGNEPARQLASQLASQLDNGGARYGARKAECERVLARIFGDGDLPGHSGYSGVRNASSEENRLLILRPGLLVGPHDPSDRFTYWPARVARGGEVLVPAPPGRPVQWLDVRDLAAWTLDALDRDRAGAYNLATPNQGITFWDLLETCRRVSGSGAEFVWADEAFLGDRGVQPWIELPLWIPERDRLKGLMRVDARKAAAAGLTCRPLADTVADVLAWDRARRAAAAERGANLPWRAGLASDREAALLADWRATVGERGEALVGDPPELPPPAADPFAGSFRPPRPEELPNWG